MNGSNFSMCEGFGAASAKDIANLLRVDDAASEVVFDDPAEEEIHTWEGDLFLTAWENDRFAGFGRARKDGWVTHVFVRPEYRRQGLGSRILSGLEEKLRQSGKRTVFLNAEPTARTFFESNGWILSESESVDHHGLLLCEMTKPIGE